MRVTIEHKDRFSLLGQTLACDAHLTGTLLQEANKKGRRPAVGDWVALADSGLIEHLFDRRSAFVRLNSRGKTQVISANIDLVLIVSSCNAEFNLRRIERYLSAVGQSGAQPAIVLSKIDLCDDPQLYLEKLQEICGESPIYPVATPLGTGLPELQALLKPGLTLSLVGSSGVGKSTLANALLGHSLFETAPIRESDAKGRHTTTRRELAVLDDERGILIDTPGMRELHLGASKEGLENAFPDIQTLAASCQFRNCHHRREPGCAVRGEIVPERLRNFHALVDEGDRKQHYDKRASKKLQRGNTRGRKK